MFGTTLDMGQILRFSRKAMGLSQASIAKFMGVSQIEWITYERNRKLIPANIIMKLIMFGMDFWCNNSKWFIDDIETLDPNTGTADK